MGTTLEDLFSIPFSFLTLEEQIKVVFLDMSRPHFSLNLNACSGKVIIDDSVYDRIPWLTGSILLQQLFCWPCVLFSKVKDIWNEIAAAGENLDKKFDFANMSKHEQTCGHIQASLELKLFIMKCLPTVKDSLVPTHTKVISVNRQILKYLTDTVCTCVATKLPPGSENYNFLLEIEVCEQTLQFVRNYDDCGIHEIDSAIKLIKDYPQFINDVVDAITKVIKNSVKKEAHMSTYVTLIFNEHSDTADKSLISTVLRYLKRGNVCERFLGFFNLEHKGFVNALCQHVSNVLSEFNIKERFLAYSLDGRIVQTSFLTDFVNIMKMHHPLTFFVPWHAHELKIILKQSFLQVKEFNFFFKTMDAFDTFFQKYCKRWKMYEEFSGRFVFNSGNTWFIQSATIEVVCAHRMYFIGFLDSILENSIRCETEDIAQISGFRKYLNEFQTIFLLHAFSRLFEIISDFSIYVKNKTPEEVFSCVALDELRNSLRVEEGNGFSMVWFNVVAENKIDSQPRSQSGTSNNTLYYLQQFQKIIGHAICEIDTRFVGLKSLEFCGLLRSTDYFDFKSVTIHLANLNQTHGPYFDFKVLLEELEQLKKYAPVLPEDSIDTLFDFFVVRNMRDSFKCLYKLAELSMTLPIRQSPNGAAKWNKITNWASGKDALSGDVSMLCVELDHLKELKKSPSFYDEVITKFYEVNKTIELI